MAIKAANLADDKKAKDILVLDLRKLSNITDYFVICSGDSDTHVRAIADSIVDELKKNKEKCWHKEGFETGTWVLLDYGDVIMHVFDPQTRDYYDIERLWGDAEIIFGELPSGKPGIKKHH